MLTVAKEPVAFLPICFFRKMWLVVKFLFFPMLILFTSCLDKFSASKFIWYHRRSQGSRDPFSPKFIAYLVILCFEKRRPKQKYCWSPKVKHIRPPKKFWADYATLWYCVTRAMPGAVINDTDFSLQLSRQTAGDNTPGDVSVVEGLILPPHFDIINGLWRKNETAPR